MTILIDADGCPVVDLTLQTAAKYNVPVLILCDTAHQIQRDGAQTLTFGKGADSVDFALVNRVCAGDLVITQDYGLASMCLARCARVLNQNGLEFTVQGRKMRANIVPPIKNAQPCSMGVGYCFCRFWGHMV